MPKNEKLPDYEALDDIGFVGWGQLTPAGEIEIPKRIQNFLREQAEKKAAPAPAPAIAKVKRRKTVSRGKARSSH